MAGEDLALPRTLGRRLGALPVAFGLLVAFIVTYGLNHSWKATFGALFDRISGVGISVPHLPSVHPFGFVGRANQAIERWFSDAQKYSEKGVVWGINNSIELPLLLAGSAAAIGMSIFELGEWTADYVRKVVGAQHAARTDPRLRQLQTDILRDEARLRDLERWKRAGGAAAGTLDHAQLQRGIDSLKKDVAQIKTEIHGKAHADVHTGALAVPDVIGIPHWIARRLSRVEKATVGLGAVALVTAALVRMGFKFMKCESWKGAARHVTCGMGSLLELLLAEAWNVLLIRDLCGMVKVIEKIAIAFEDDLLRLVNEVEGFICGGEAVVPSGIVKADLRKVTKHPTAITAYDLQPPVARKIAA